MAALASLVALWLLVVLMAVVLSRMHTLIRLAIRTLHEEVDEPRTHTYPLPIKAFCGHESRTLVLYPGGIAFCAACHDAGRARGA